MNAGYLRQGHEVVEREWHYIKTKRGYPEEKRWELAGLAISGGGIRSAAFGLGVLQGLVRIDRLEDVDYLSTVSGGGYIGASLTWFLHRPRGERSYGVRADDFPLGQRMQGARPAQDAPRPQDNAILNFIRQRANYLSPGRGLNLVSMGAVVLRSLLLGLIVHFPLLALLVYGLDEICVLLGATSARFGLSLPGAPGLFHLSWLALGLAILFALTSVFYSVATYVRVDEGSRYWLRLELQRWAGVVIALMVALLMLASLPLADALLRTYVVTPGIAAAASSGLGALGGLVRFWLAQRRGPETGGALSRLLVWIASALLLYGMLLLAFILVTRVEPWDWLWTVGVAVATGWLVNLNYVSLHRMYRDRLMETFLPNHESVQKNCWAPATEADRAKLSEMCGPEAAGPYHLINTNVILTDSNDSKFRGRGGDSFLLSPLFCGSDATGWRATREWMDDGMTLPTAMAISGAALNPRTGVAGRGPTRTPALSFLMQVLNLRLGYWARHPDPDRSRLAQPPNYFWPGIKAALGKGFHELSGAIELSDGGHFDNTGLYELVRREVATIVISDAGADPGFTFEDLGNAIERVRVDFGVAIRFYDPDADLARLLPRAAGDTLYDLKYGLAARGWARARIDYPSGLEGLLVYIKSTLTRDLPADIYAYKSAYPDFPDQPTGDQFFDEAQFEAYRELGYQLTRRLAEETDGGARRATAA